MVGERYDEEPQYFHVLHVPTPLRRLYRRRRRLDEEIRVDSFNASLSPDHAQRYISDPLVLRQPGWRLRRGYRVSYGLGPQRRLVLREGSTFEDSPALRRSATGSLA